MRKTNIKSSDKVYDNKDYFCGKLLIFTIFFAWKTHTEWKILIFSHRKNIFFVCFQQFNLLSLWIKCCFLLSLGCRMFWISLYLPPCAPESDSTEERKTLWNVVVRFYWNHPITIRNDTFTRKKAFQDTDEKKLPRIQCVGVCIWDSKGCVHVINSEKNFVFL